MHSYHIYMIRTEHWKYVAYQGFRPQLFDLVNNPDECVDLGDTPEYETLRQDMQSLLLRLHDEVAQPGYGEHGRCGGGY